MQELSEMDISMIRNMMRINGNKHIADTLEIDIDQVNKVVIDIYQQTGIVPKQLMIDQIEKDKLEWRQELKKAQLQRKQELDNEKQQLKLKQQQVKEEAKLQLQKEREQKRLLPKVKVKRVQFSKPVKQVSPHAANTAYHEQRKKDNDRRKFATIDVDLKQMQSVRIDERTTIFIKPGESVTEARMHYLDRENAKKEKLYKKTSYERWHDKNKK